MPPREAVEWTLRAVGGASRVLSIAPLRGGKSHANHVLRIEAGGEIREVVLRRWVRGDWQETDPEFSPAQEAATYGLLASSPAPAPRLLAADLEGRECDVPALLLTREPGTNLTTPNDIASRLTEFASALLLVHGFDRDRASRTLPPYRPYYGRERLRVPAWTRWPSIWERAIEVATGPEPGEPAAFIHRDYHPGNTLWISGKLTAIVDWTTASWGPPAVDLAHMRANLAMSCGVESADEFLDAYRVTLGSPYVHDPYWDLRVAVDFLPDLPSDGRRAARLGRLDDFVARSIGPL
ncbi:MAG: phosphotransferase [Candidatus Limnocylindrales bacterium]|jgi:aminoglycoside phosphotransferase (APT) family kinase protein